MRHTECEHAHGNTDTDWAIQQETVYGKTNETEWIIQQEDMQREECCKFVLEFV